MATETCESCGSIEPLAEVRRIYVTPAAWDTEERIDVQEATERWCVPCRTMYPHLEPGDVVQDD